MCYNLMKKSEKYDTYTNCIFRSSPIFFFGVFTFEWLNEESLIQTRNLEKKNKIVLFAALDERTNIKYS